MKQVRVPLHKQPARYATVEDGATRGAVLGETLFNADGSVLTLAQLIALAQGAATQGGGTEPPIEWGGITGTVTDQSDLIAYLQANYSRIPLTVRNANYTFVATDTNTGVVHDDTTARSYTVDGGVHAAGDIITILNATGTGAVTIVQGGGGMTLRLAGSTSTGNRTVAVRGLATIVFASSTEAYVSGPGVT